MKYELEVMAGPQQTQLVQDEFKRVSTMLPCMKPDNRSGTYVGDLIISVEFPWYCHTGKIETHMALFAPQWQRVR